MSNGDETPNKGDPQNMAFVINVMQQQFERLNMVFREFRERMDRQDAVITKGSLVKMK